MYDITFAYNTRKIVFFLWRNMAIFPEKIYEFTFYFYLEHDYNNFHLVCPYYTLRYLITISRLRKQRRRINIEEDAGRGRSSGTNYNLQARKSLAGTA